MITTLHHADPTNWRRPPTSIDIIKTVEGDKPMGMTVKELVASLQDLPKEYQDQDIAIAYDGQVNMRVDVVTTFKKRNWDISDPDKLVDLVVLTNREDQQLKDKWS